MDSLAALGLAVGIGCCLFVGYVILSGLLALVDYVRSFWRKPPWGDDV